MKGRQAADSTRCMFNLLRIAEIRKSPSVFLALDAEKAFDKVHWGYLQTTLTKFGFQGLIKRAISALYTSPSAQVFTSIVISDHFFITNGTRQGCHLSPRIFSLIMEPLAAFIRSHPQIHGITVSEQVHKIGLFTDDVILNSRTCVPLSHTLQHRIMRLIMGLY